MRTLMQVRYIGIRNRRPDWVLTVVIVDGDLLAAPGEIGRRPGTRARHMAVTASAHDRAGADHPPNGFGVSAAAPAGPHPEPVSSCSWH